MDKKHFEFLEIMQQAEDKWILAAGEPWKGERSYRRFSVMAKAACVLLVLVLGVSCMFHEQAGAAITQALTKIGQWMENENDISPYVENVMQSKTIDGITVNLKEVLLGKDKITAFVSLEGCHASTEGRWVSIDAVTINGEYIDNVSIDSYAQEDETEFGMKYICEKGAMPENIREIGLTICYYEREGDGYWGTSENFEFTVFPEKSGIEQGYFEHSLDIDIEGGGGQVFHLKEYTYNKAEGEICVLCDKDPREYESEELKELGLYGLPYIIKILDDYGNTSDFYAVYYDEEEGEIRFESESGTPPRENSEYLDIQFFKREISEDGTFSFPKLVEEKRIEFVKMREQE